MAALGDGQAVADAPDIRSRRPPLTPARWPPTAKAPAWLATTCRAVVDAKHHLIIAHEVTNVGHDRFQLAEKGDRSG